MASRKRGRAPDEAPDHTKKHHRVQKEQQNFDPISRPNNDEEEPGRPGPHSHRVFQAELHHSPPVQLPPQQPDEGAIPLQRRRTEPPRPQNQPGQGARPRQKLKINPPKPQIQPGPSQGEPADPGSSHSETSTCYSQDVANYDIEPGAEDVGTPAAKDLEYWGSEKGAAEFIRSKSGLETNWVGIRPLGKGGYAITGLWEMRDDDGQTTKQMVIKEEVHTRSIWKKFKATREVPVEVRVMSKLNKTHCHAIPRLFMYKRYPHVHKHRIYMEFCPFKDLSELCKRYKRFRQYLPEPFLWDTFYHLVEAAVAMRDGPEGARWDFEIVHRDLKPGNIFLGKENAEKGFPFYPIAKTGDFGVAVMTKQGDPLNPLEYQNIGTHGYYAPEQLHDDVTPRNQKDRLSSYTNVWAIGATMLELLTLSPHIDYMNDPDYNVDGVITDIETDKKPEYSIALRDLIKSCLEPKPLERIKIGSLRACIKSNRDHLSETYEQSDKNGRARFEDDNLLYYIRNEINNMPPGRYEPIDPESPSKPEVVRFRDYDWPVVFPRFHDGPESEGEGSDDSDDSDSDDESDDGGSPERMLPKNTVHQSTGHRMSNPIDLVNDTAGKYTDTSDIWRRKDTRRKQGNARSEISDTGGAVKGSLRDGTRPSNSRLSDARAVGAVREDGGVEGLEDSLTDGLPVEAPEDGTDDESQPMESDSDDSVSMPSSSHQVPAPAAQAPAHAPTPAVQAQALAPQAPAPAPAPVQPIPRKLRSGVTFGYF